MGPLVGVSFISAVQTYAEASGLNGTSVGVGEAFSPLIGVWAPTFSGCELAAAFLLPFVCIRLPAATLVTVALGHFLNGGLTIALGTATAVMTDHPSTAAIVTLGITVGTWILNFVAAVHGGIWQRAAEPVQLNSATLNWQLGTGN
jgi:hypothetical protein